MNNNDVPVQSNLFLFLEKRDLFLWWQVFKSFNPYIHDGQTNFRRMVKFILEIVRDEHGKIFKVCLFIF